MDKGQKVTGYIENRDLGRVDFAGTVTDVYCSGRDTLVAVACDDGQERTARAENVQAVPAAKLTPKMQDALDKIRTNGGRVGGGLLSLNALGVNGHSANALQDRGLLRVEFDENKTCWLVLVD